MRTKILGTVVLTLICGYATVAQVKERVKFAPGATGAVKTGAVSGYAYHDYVIGAKAGQKMTLSLTSKLRPSVFDVMKPDGSDLDAATEMNDVALVLPQAGDYVIRVLMMRSEARRKGSRSNYTLKIQLTN